MEKSMLPEVNVMGSMWCTIQGGAVTFACKSSWQAWQDWYIYILDGVSTITDEEISLLVAGVGPNELSQIATSYLKIPHATVQTYQASARENQHGFKIMMLKDWCNRNHGPNVRSTLYGILRKAASAGLIDPDIFNFLVEKDDHGKN